jgi:tetratricopeptide (TPR) repeat protein
VLEDPQRILAEIKSLIDAHYYSDAKQKISRVLNSNFDKESRRQLLLLKIRISLVLAEEVDPDLQLELEDHLKSATNDEARAEILLAIGYLGYGTGRFHEAKVVKALQEALRLYRKLSNSKATVVALNTLAIIYFKQGAWDEGITVVWEALKLAKESGDTEGYGRALLYFGIYERFHGRHDFAVSHYERAIQYLEEAGDLIYLSTCLNNLADLEIAQGNLTKGLHLLQLALYQWRIIGHQEKIGIIRSQMGRAYILKGSIRKAKAFLDSAKDLKSPDQVRNPLELVYELCIRAELERSQGNLDQALKLAEKAIVILEEVKNTGIDLAYTWILITNIFLAMGKIPQAEGALEMSEVICSSLDYSEGIVNTMRLRGIVELQKDNLGLAQEYLEKASKKAEEQNYIELQILAELSLADLYLRKLRISFNELGQKNAKRCIIRASHLAEQSTLEPGKLEAKILEAVAHSIDLAFEKAMKILSEVETKARSLKLHLVEEKAHRIRDQMRKTIPETDLAAEEMVGYMIKAQKYLQEAQAAFKST